MRLAISISPSRVSSSTVPHLAHVHAHRVSGAAELAVNYDRAASASSSASFGGGTRAGVGQQQGFGVGASARRRPRPGRSAWRPRPSSVSVSTSLSGRWSLISPCVRVAARLASFGSVFRLARRVLISSGRARLHPGRIPSSRPVPWPWIFMRSGLGFSTAPWSTAVDLRFALQVGLDVGQIFLPDFAGRRLCRGRPRLPTVGSGVDFSAAAVPFGRTAGGVWRASIFRPPAAGVTDRMAAAVALALLVEFASTSRRSSSF